MEHGERGAIVNIASVAAFDGQIGQASYSASKGGVVGMTLPIARDLSAVGIRVNTVAPGLIDTPIYGEGEASEQFKENLQKGVLFPKRLGDPEQLASMVIECITNSYMNAEIDPRRRRHPHAAEVTQRRQIARSGQPLSGKRFDRAADRARLTGSAVAFSHASGTRQRCRWFHVA